MLSCGQEVNSMCDNSQAKIHDSVSVLWTKAGWAELGLDGVEEVGLGGFSVAWMSILLCCFWLVSGGDTVT